MEIGTNILSNVWLWVFGIFIIFSLLIQFIAYITMGVCKSKKNMTGKTVLITGCAFGIGREAARDLAARGARLIMADINLQAALRVKDEIVSESGNKNLVVKKVDMSSFKSIRSFADAVNNEEEKLDVLIHNAGTTSVFKRKFSEDGIELTFATNQYGPFLLTHLLIGLLKRSAPSRIIVTSSVAHHLGWLDLEDPTKSFCPGWIYCNSKLANVVWTLELAKRLEGSGVTVNCLYPGIVNTDIWRKFPPPLVWIIVIILKLYAKTPVQGSQTTIHLAVSDEVEGISGKYFVDCKPFRLSKKVKDPLRAKKLWEHCEEVTKIQPIDPKI